MSNNEWLYTIKPARKDMLANGLTNEEADAMAAHFEYLKALHAQGQVILAGRTQNTDESSFGIGIFRAANEEEAWKIVNGDPAVQRGVVTPSLFPYRVALLGKASE